MCALGCIGLRDGDILVAKRAVPVLKRAGELLRTSGRPYESNLRYESPDMSCLDVPSASEAASEAI